METIETKLLLSVSLHVAHGYVGNRSVVFPLQCLGWDVDVVNTTNFLNHPGYGFFEGHKSDALTIDSLFQGLRKIQDPKNPYKMVLVGYCPSAGMLGVVYAHAMELKKANPDLLIVVDPVLGDNGRLYVPEEVVPVHKEFLEKGLVSLMTPNQFELELLSGIEVTDRDTAERALKEFHRQYRVPYVVLTSVMLDGKMAAVGLAQKGEEADIFYANIDRIECSFNGCGDVFASLITHAFHKNGGVLNPLILSGVVCKMGKILDVSYAVEKQKTGQSPTTVKDIALVALRHLFQEDGRD